jgi:hypothetical protein
MPQVRSASCGTLCGLLSSEDQQLPKEWKVGGLLGPFLGSTGSLLGSTGWAIGHVQVQAEPAVTYGVKVSQLVCKVRLVGFEIHIHLHALLLLLPVVW